MMATVRRDGSPRISGIEATFANGQLWLGMMPDSRKALDLRGDPRLAVHSAPIDMELSDGDARVSGRAIEYTDEATKSAFGRTFEETRVRRCRRGLFTSSRSTSRRRC
jgi:hypothetical protein